jgi:hypothetical protein
VELQALAQVVDARDLELVSREHLEPVAELREPLRRGLLEALPDDVELFGRRVRLLTEGHRRQRR